MNKCKNLIFRGLLWTILVALLFSCCACDKAGKEEVDHTGKIQIWVLTEIVYPASGSTPEQTYRFTYDKNGGVEKESMVTGGQTYVSYEHTYDDRGNRTEEAYYRGEEKYTAVTYSYDAQDNLVEEISWQNGEKYSQTIYDNKGNIAEEIFWENGQEASHDIYTYVYNQQGLITERRNTHKKLGNGIFAKYGEEVITYTYDEQGNLLEERTAVNGDETDRTAYTYDDRNNRIEIKRFENGEEVEKLTLVYDENGNLVEEKTEWSGGEGGRSTYTYDEKGQRLERVNYYAGEEMERYTYAYDENGRVIKKREDFSDGTFKEVINQYDEKGNLIEETQTTRQPSYAGEDTVETPEMVESTASYVYTYDENGNMTQRLLRTESGEELNKISLKWESVWVTPEQAEKLYGYFSQYKSSFYGSFLLYKFPAELVEKTKEEI